MKLNIVDQIIRERELKNEKIISYCRFLIIFIFFIFDVLIFANIISAYEQKVTLIPVILDSIFLIYATVIAVILTKNIYLSYLKYIVITLDFSLLASYMLLDPTITASNAYWIGFIVLILFYTINVLRYSKAATIYSGILVVVIFIMVIFVFEVANDPNLAPLIISMLLFIFIGYAITISNRKMIIEANTKKFMERYLAPQLVNQLYEKNISLDPGGKNRVVTILFSDIRDFTGISENL